MIRDDIIRMAREAGFVSAEFWPGDFAGLHASVERFAAIVQREALEEAARACKVEADIRALAAEKHPEDSPSRDRCYAAARAANNCEIAIRALMPPTQPKEPG